MYGENQYGSVQYGGVGGNYAAYTSTLNETATLSETIRKSPIRIFFDQLIADFEYFNTVKARGLEFIENITLIEIYRRARTRIFIEVGTLTEFLSKSKQFFYNLLDSFSGITDNFSRIRNRFFTFIEVVTISEIITKIKGMLLLENITLSETITTNYGRILELLDSFSGFADNIAKITRRNISDTFVISDNIRKYINGLLINFWIKTTKTVSSFTKLVKPSSAWTKTTKPY